MTLCCNPYRCSPFGGTIYPVNARRRANIFGIRSYQRVYEIPERGIDLAIIAVPAGAVKEVRVPISVMETDMCAYKMCSFFVSYCIACLG